MGLTTGDIQGHLAEIYGTSVSKDTMRRVVYTTNSIESLNARSGGLSVTGGTS